MKIKGGKDYYDFSTVGYDTEDNVVFVRSRLDNSKGVEEGIYPREMLGFNYQGFMCNPVVVFFCGKLYRGLEYRKYAEYPKPEIHEFVWKYDEFVALLEQQEVKISDYQLDGKTVREWVETRVTLGETKLDNSLLEKFIKRGVVLAVCRRETSLRSDVYGKTTWHENVDGLGQMRFASVVDAWQARQEVEMFLGSTLVDTEDKMVKLADKEVIGKHGFDKFSFRNQVHPSKPRNK